MKTIIDFLNVLPEPYRSQALKEMEKPDNIEKKTNEVESMEDALLNAFSWSDADSSDESLKPGQGRIDYWDKAATKFKDLQP